MAWKVSKATFNENDHCLTAGWATYHKPADLGHRLDRLACRILGHRYSVMMPIDPSGHSPSCYQQCLRCTNFLKWFVVGQHRFGSVNADVWAAWNKLPNRPEA